MNQCVGCGAQRMLNNYLWCEAHYWWLRDNPRNRTWDYLIPTPSVDDHNTWIYPLSPLESDQAPG